MRFCRFYPPDLPSRVKRAKTSEMEEVFIVNLLIAGFINNYE